MQSQRCQKIISAGPAPGFGAKLSLTTISGSTRGARIRATDNVACPVGAWCTVSSYMLPQTSVRSFIACHTALFARPIFRPTVLWPAAPRTRAISASTA